jgi:hypothetical protein
LAFPELSFSGQLHFLFGYSSSNKCICGELEIVGGQQRIGCCGALRGLGWGEAVYAGIAGKDYNRASKHLI